RFGSALALTQQARIAASARRGHAPPRTDAGRKRSPIVTACDRRQTDYRRWTCPIPLRAAGKSKGKPAGSSGVHRPAAAARPSDEKTCAFYAAFSVSLASVGRPSSIGSDGSRDHSFHDPKYIRTSFTPAFLSARKVLDARAPLKQ